MEIIDDKNFAALEDRAHTLLAKNCSPELQKALDNDPPLRLHVRASPPKREHLEQILNLREAAKPVPEELALRKWLAPMIDHTVLKPGATLGDIEKLCNEAKEFGIGAVCVNPVYVEFCKRALQGTKTSVITVVGFPLGCNTTQIKIQETKDAIANGATEIDMVLNVGELRSANYESVWRDIQSVVQATDPHPVKVIIESASLSNEEKVLACWLSKAGGAHFVKTSTGFSANGGATTHDIALMRRAVGSSVALKASGGVKTLREAIAMILAGADRIGSSASVDMLMGKI